MRNQLLNTFYLLPASLVFLSGCAWYDIEALPPEKSDTPPAKGEGYVFYAPEPFLRVTMQTALNADGKTTTTTVSGDVIYLPNKKRPFRISTHNWLGKSDFTFKFVEGWQLTDISDKSDNSSTLNALAGQISAVITAAKSKPDDKEAGPRYSIQLFRIDWDTGVPLLKKVQGDEIKGP